MKKMKRVVAMLLAVVMVFGLAACVITYFLVVLHSFYLLFSFFNTTTYSQ